MKAKDIKISELPEEVDGGVKIYGPASYETQVAILSHYLHTLDGKHDVVSGEKRYEILNAIRDFIEYKHQQDKKNLMWEDVSDEVVTKAADSPLESDLFADFFNVPFPAPKNPKFTFIDLFAGIGGFRIAMQELGGKCVYSSEFDTQAQRTYFANYGEMPFGDITKEVTKKYIPQDFDILCGGFPCQAFSLAGRRLGFKDETRGTLFFEIEEILHRHQPKAFFLENVKGLMIHDKGRTLRTILDHLDQVGYDVVPPQIVNAMDFGVPQHRERVYIIGFRKDLYVDVAHFQYPEPTTPEGKRVPFKKVMEKNEVSVKYYLSDVYLETLRKHRARHEAAGHGFGYEIIDKNGVANAIVVGGMGRERNLVKDDRLTNFRPSPKANLSKSAKEKYGAKTDIIVTTEDSFDHVRTTGGFSIKSHIGKSPTLFNCSQSSGFLYKIIGCDVDGMKRLNYKDGFLDIISVIKEEYSLEYVGCRNEIFEQNIRVVDSRMDEILQNAVLMQTGYIKGLESRQMSEVCKALAVLNPIGVRNPEVFYEAKLKAFLFASFAGMTASEEWSGRKKLTGGYIDVDRDGELLYYRAISDDIFENYLFKHTYVDRPDRGYRKDLAVAEAKAAIDENRRLTDEEIFWIEHSEKIDKKTKEKKIVKNDKKGDFGYVYQDGDNFYIVINFQVRFR